MFKLLVRAFANLSLLLRQPITTFCDLDTADGDALLTKTGEYATFLEVDGLRRFTMRADIEATAENLRVDLSGALDAPGHAIQAWYACDPNSTSVEIERSLGGCRAIARQLDMVLTDIFEERARLWPRLMRAERCVFVVWSKRSILTREERKQASQEQMAAGKGSPSFGEAQNPLRATEIMSAKHTAFVQRVVNAFRGQGIGIRVLQPREALILAREAIYPETAASDWQPMLPGSNVMPRLPEDNEKADAGLILWPSIADQLFRADAITHGGTRVEIGEHEWAPVDMVLGPEDPRPFAEIVSRLNSTHNPWRMSMLVEGGGRNMMAFKKAAATILGFVPANKQIYQAFLELKRIRDDNIDIVVKVRTSFATWVPSGETRATAPAGVHAGAAAGRLGQLPGGDHRRRSAGRRDEHGPRPGDCLHGAAGGSTAWRGAAHVALGPARIRMANRRRSVSNARWEDLAFRSIGIASHLRL